MVWEIPRDERPNHVCNPWVWIPDVAINDVAVVIQSVDDLMDHLRTIPRSVLPALSLSGPSALALQCQSWLLCHDPHELYQAQDWPTAVPHLCVSLM